MNDRSELTFALDHGASDFKKSAPDLARTLDRTHRVCYNAEVRLSNHSGTQCILVATVYETVLAIIVYL